eukprot:6472870-Amphidinium_carterae.2
MAADDVGDENFGVQAVMKEAEERIRKVHSGYRDAGLIRKEAKAQAKVSSLTLWGATVNGDRKVVSGIPEKIKALVHLTASLLDRTTSWLRRDETGKKRRRLGAKVRDELLGLVLLWPLLKADMQMTPSLRAYASDATVARGAVVESSRLSVEEATFFWSRRKQKHEEMVRSSPEGRDLFDFPEAVRPEQDSLLEHVVLPTPWHISASYRFRRHSHINVQELLAYRTALRAASRRRECWKSKTPFFIDSQVVVNVISRGRSSSHQLNYILQTSLALCLFCSITPLPIWIGTEENPADDPTRNRALREKLPLDEREHALPSLRLRVGTGGSSLSPERNGWREEHNGTAQWVFPEKVLNDDHFQWRTPGST